MKRQKKRKRKIAIKKLCRLKKSKLQKERISTKRF